MAPWKSPRPDGLPTGFYQNTQKIVGGNVCRYIKDLWHSVADNADVNCTKLCLFPKLESPQTVH